MPNTVVKVPPKRAPISLTEVQKRSNTETVLLLNERDVAALLGITTRALQAWRVRGYGPRFARISPRAIRYRRKDVEAWVAQQMKSSTSEY